MTEIGLLSQLSPALQDFLKNMKISGEERAVPNISWSTAGEIIRHLQNISVKNILEIGPANGFSTIMMSLGVPSAQITSIEFSRHAFEELRANLATFSKLQQREIKIGVPADFGRKVTSDIFQEDISNFSVFFGDAREVLPHFQAGNAKTECERPKSTLNIPKKTFEVIFIDGAFRMTREFYDLSVPLLSPGGIIIIDDVIKYRWKMNGFYEYLDSLGVKYEIIQTDPDDGIMIVKF